MEIRKSKETDKKILLIVDDQSYKKVKEISSKKGKSITLMINEILEKWRVENDKN